MANQPKRDQPLDDDDEAVDESDSDDADARDDNADEDEDEDEDDEEEAPPPAAKKASAQRPASGKKVAAPVKRSAPVDEVEDEEDEDEEEPPPPRRKPVSTKAARTKPAVAPRRRPRPAPKLPDEDEIDAPKKQTLWMLGALAVAIVSMWGASRFACNAHPMQTRKPREIPTSELAKDPKGAALELAQRWASYDFAGALELAKGPLAAQLSKEQQQCEQDKSGCDSKRAEQKDKVLATAVLISREANLAKARVSTEGGATGKETYVLTLDREGNSWKASAKGPDTGLPPPVPTMAPTLAPAPSAVPTPSPAPSP
jgi:hypothetical protein